jgi:hypothetical protein
MKYKDELLTNQKVVFPLIETILRCPVKLVRIDPKPIVQTKARN